MKTLFFAYAFSFLIIHSYGAISISQVSIPEKQLFRALYKFTQVAEKDREPIVLTDTMELKIGNHRSLYKDWNQSLKDSLLIKTMKDIDSRRQVVIHYGTYDEFISNSNEVSLNSKSWETANLYKDRSNNKIIIIDEIEEIGLVRSEDFQSQEWKVSTDTTSIQGYLCYKATTSFRGREYIAWFTLEIPINDGPWKFHGLPGLILKVQDNDQLFEIQLIGFEKADDDLYITIDEEVKYTKCSPEQYNKLKRETLKKANYYNFQDTYLRLYYGNNLIKYNFLEK